ncbi:MAG: SMI1/KNR4 family protein [Oscillospiraceae bacterium]|nr:SMI1/KNR4 family protein [Oscillospiraceae bacterium]
MENIVDALRNIPDYIGSNGRTEEIILKAESSLGVAFAQDYRQYLGTIGLACFDGHELTGLTDITRLDVVTVTKEQRAININIPVSWYVVEETNIDGIVIWQNESGKVYQTAPSSLPVKIANSLLEYIRL